MVEIAATAQEVAELRQQVVALVAASSAQAASTTAVQTELQRARDENKILKQTLEGGLAALPALVEVIKAQKEPKSQAQLIDQRGLGKPFVFTEKEDKFPAWVRKTENFVISVFGEEFRQVLQWAMECDGPIDESDWDVEFGAGAQEEVPPR